MNPPFETESVYSVTDQTQSGTRPSQPRQFPGTITEDSGGPGAGPEDVPESMPGGADLAELQKLEHRLLEATAWQTGDSTELAVILHNLGQVNGCQGHHAEAMEYLRESLQMKRSLHGDGDHPEVAATLQVLGRVTHQSGSLKEALRYLKESLRMDRSLHRDGDHAGIAVTLSLLGRVTAETGDLKEALRYLKESLRMDRSLHGDGDHAGIAVTLSLLGRVTAQTGDLKEALRYLKESLRMELLAKSSHSANVTAVLAR